MTSALSNYGQQCVLPSRIHPVVKPGIVTSICCSALGAWSAMVVVPREIEPLAIIVQVS